MKFFPFFLTKKSIIYGVIIILGAGATVFVFLKNADTKEEMLVIHPRDFVQQVSASGKVAATDSLDLSFEQGGRVINVRVKVGDKVIVGQPLVKQDTAQLNAQLAEMQAGVDLQKAKLAQLLAGASPEDIAVVETTAANTEISVANSEQTLENAKQNMADKLQDAYTKADDAVRSKADQMFSNPRSSSPQLSFSSSDSQDIERGKLLIESTLNSWVEKLQGISARSDFASATTLAKKNLDQARLFLDKLSLVANGLTPNSNLTQTTVDKWKTDIGTARTNVNTAVAGITSAEEKLKIEEADLKTAKGNLKKAQDELKFKKSPARSSDIALNEAQIRQAEASSQNIVAELNKRQIRSPINGVVTIVNSKVGSIVAANEAAVSLISIDTLQIESYVPEKSIPLVKIGDQAVITLDAYGGDVPFMVKVVSIDPAETIRDGVSTYKVKLQFFDRDERLKSGMTANVLITTEKKSNTIVVPQGIIISKNGQKFVKVKEGNAIFDRKVETGGVSSLGQVEITSGLKDGDRVMLK